jgi:serine/threonine-protein kinase
MAVRCEKCNQGNPDDARFCASCGAAILAPRDRDPLIGSVIGGRFRVLSVIGEGGMGRVYRAEQELGATSRPVAIKVLTTNPGDEKAVQRFHREIATVVSLHHPNTIRIYDTGALPDGRLYIAMELVEGRSLQKAIQEGPMPLAVVERLVSQIGGALAEAHRRGIVHRDLKPDNVLLASHTEEGEDAKILDFGIAKNDRHMESSEVTAQGTIVGTPAYMSPEQLSGKDVDPRSDVYALGLMTYEMLTGSRPFKNCQTPLEWATAHLTKDPVPFDEFPATKLLPESKRAAILHALQKEPAARTASALRNSSDRLSASRAEVTGDAPTVAARTPRVSQPAPQTRDSEAPALPTTPRRRWLVYLLGAGGMTLAGAALVFAYFGGTRPPTIHDTPPPADAGVALPVEEPDAGPVVEWAHLVNASTNADSAELVLGPPDGRCAVLRTNGRLTVEFPRHETPNTDAPDILVAVVESRSGPYRVDVAMDRHGDTFTTLGSEIAGSTPVDVDQFDLHAFRYVRIKNLSRTQLACIDAIGVYVDGPLPGVPGMPPASAPTP